MKVLLADQSGWDGKKERNVVLRKMLQRFRVNIEDWNAASSNVSTEECLIFAHVSTRTKSEIATVLPNWASLGATVVLYSGGGGTVSRDDRCGAGRIIEMNWDALKQVVSQLTEGLDVAMFYRALESVQNRHVINALAIVAWCSTVPTDNTGIRNRQAEWLSDRRRWLKLFEHCSPMDFATACGVGSPPEIPKQLSAIKGVVDWLWPASGETPSAPNFKLAITQIKTHFNVQV